MLMATAEMIRRYKLEGVKIRQKCVVMLGFPKK
jgi:hypothetical protein